MWKHRTFAQLLAAFVLAPLQVLAQGVAPTGERLGLKGYDPVAYFTDGKPRPGASEFEYSWDGVRYRFASAAHRESLQSEPRQICPTIRRFLCHEHVQRRATARSRSAHLDDL